MEPIILKPESSIFEKKSFRFRLAIYLYFQRGLYFWQLSYLYVLGFIWSKRHGACTNSIVFEMSLNKRVALKVHPSRFYVDQFVWSFRSENRNLESIGDISFAFWFPLFPLAMSFSSFFCNVIGGFFILVKIIEECSTSMILKEKSF